MAMGLGLGLGLSKLKVPKAEDIERVSGNLEEIQQIVSDGSDLANAFLDNIKEVVVNDSFFKSIEKIQMLLDAISQLPT